MATPPVVYTDSPEGDAYLSDIIHSGGVVALLGSGISMWEPSNMPNGQKITEELAKLIAASTVAPTETVIKLIKRTAFEHIMERYPKPAVLNSTVATVFYPTTPNPIHEAFARMLESGCIEHIITTNYDVGIETACNGICSSSRMPHIIVRESDLTSVSPRRPILFKIHGCASPGFEDTLVMTLATEGEMPEWKRRLLETLINGKHLFVCGYSGLDFEISPELSCLTPSKTTWNSFQDPKQNDDALTENAKRVLDKTKGIALVGDMNTILQKLTGQTWSASFSKISPSFVQKLVNALDHWELDKWRVWVLNGLGCALDGTYIARRMLHNSGASDLRKLDSLLALAEALFHRGLYKQSSSAYKKAAKLSHSTNDVEKRLKAELGVVESLRVAGYWIRAMRRIKKVAKSFENKIPATDREKVETAILLKRVLLRRYPFYLSRLLKMSWWTNSIYEKAKQELQRVTDYSAKNGSWFDLQHCEMLAKKFDIPFSGIYSGTMMPMPSREGYKQLGYIVAEMMAYRATLSDSNIINPPLEFDYLRIAKAVDINPELWKVARAIERRFGKDSLSTMDQDAARLAWKRCEYTLPMRLLLRFRSEDA